MNGTVQKSRRSLNFLIHIKNCNRDMLLKLLTLTLKAFLYCSKFENSACGHNLMNTTVRINYLPIFSILVPVVMLSACFNSPKFWEIDVVTRDANKMRWVCILGLILCNV